MPRILIEAFVIEGYLAIDVGHFQLFEYGSVLFGIVGQPLNARVGFDITKFK
jgi:hypothetical protein